MYIQKKTWSEGRVTERYSLREAQNRLRQLIADAQQGKTVVILDEDEGAVQLVPVAPTPKPRKAGSARGKIKMSADFDEPLMDEGITDL